MQIIATGVVLDDNNAIHRNWTVEALQQKGIAVIAWGPNVKAWAMATVTGVANEYRRRLTAAETHGADVTPERVMAWQRKEARATGDRASIRPSLRALLEREAAAKGRTIDQLLDIVEGKADALEDASQLIDALQAEAEAAIAALPIDEALPESLEALLGLLDSEATAAFAALQS